MTRLLDMILWASRRLRLAVMTLLAVAAVKTAASAIDDPTGSRTDGAQAPITSSAGVASQ